MNLYVLAAVKSVRPDDGARVEINATMAYDHALGERFVAKEMFYESVVEPRPGTVPDRVEDVS